MSARSELAAISTQLAEATAARDAAQEAYDWLAKPSALLREAKAAHAVEEGLHKAQVTTWYSSGCPGARPAPSYRMMELERQLGDLHSDLGANEQALEIATSGLQAATLHLAEIQARKKSSLYRVAIEAARARLRTHAVPAMIEATLQRGVVESLAAELRDRGYGAAPDTEAMQAGGAIFEAIRVAKQSIELAGDLEAAKAFLDHLASNPDAELPDPRVIQNPLGASVASEVVEVVTDTSEAAPPIPGSSAEPGAAFTLGPQPPEFPEWVNSGGPIFMPSPRRE
jgi:hypothetical protein